MDRSLYRSFCQKIKQYHSVDAVVAYAEVVFTGGRTAARMANVMMTAEQQRIHMTKFIQTNRHEPDGVIGKQIKLSGAAEV